MYSDTMEVLGWCELLKFSTFLVLHIVFIALCCVVHDLFAFIIALLKMYFTQSLIRSPTYMVIATHPTQ